MTDPLTGRDGTQALDGADALAPLPRPARDDGARPSRAPAPDPLAGGLPLPTLPAATDHGAVARWMDADAAEARRVTDPPARTTGWVDGETVDGADERGARVREAGPARLLPRDERPRPRPATPGPARAVDTGPDRAAAPGDRGEPEPEWRRERREEHEFASEFGEWRPGARPATRGRTLSPLSPLTLVILLALAVLVAVVALS